ERERRGRGDRGRAREHAQRDRRALEPGSPAEEQRGGGDERKPEREPRPRRRRLDAAELAREPGPPPVDEERDRPPPAVDPGREATNPGVVPQERVAARVSRSETER